MTLIFFDNLFTKNTVFTQQMPIVSNRKTDRAHIVTYKSTDHVKRISKRVDHYRKACAKKTNTPF